jgi:hypothetical protein
VFSFRAARCNAMTSDQSKANKLKQTKANHDDHVSIARSVVNVTVLQGAC